MDRARKISVTVDIWSSKNSVNSYFGATAHFYNPVTKKKENYRICCRKFDVKHSGFNIAKLSAEIFGEYGIESKVFKVQSDSASNMIKAYKDINVLNEELQGDFEGEDSASEESDMSDSECDEEPEDLEDDDEIQTVEKFATDLEDEELDHQVAFEPIDLERLACFQHKMQSAINKAVKGKKKSFGIILRKTRKTVIKYRRSPKAKAILKRKYKYKLAGFVKTRWWTDLVMVKSFIKCASAPGKPLENMIDLMGWGIEFTDRDINLLKSFVSIMQPIQELSDSMGAEKKSTIHLVYPSLIEVLALLDEKILELEAVDFCTSLKNQIENYFGFVLNHKEEGFNPLYVAATYLDPCYKMILDKDLVNLARVFIVKLLKKSYTEDIENPDENGDSVNLEPVVESFVIPGFSRLSKQIANKSSSRRNDTRQSSSWARKLQKDLDLYETKALNSLDKVVNKAEERHREKQAVLSNNGNEGSGSSNDAVVKPKDPLDFWIVQVCF